MYIVVVYFEYAVAHSSTISAVPCYATEFSPCGSRSFTAFLYFIHYFDLLLCSLRVQAIESKTYHQFHSICVVWHHRNNPCRLYYVWMNTKSWPVVLCSTTMCACVVFFYSFGWRDRLKIKRYLHNAVTLCILYVRIRGTHSNKHNIICINDRNINYCVCVSIRSKL